MTPDQRHILAVVEQGYILGLPDARQKAATLIASYEQQGDDGMVSALRSVASTYRHRNLKDNPKEPGPTAETAARFLTAGYGDPLERLYERGSLDEECRHAGREIASIVEFVTAGMGAAMMRYDERTDRGKPGGPEWMALLHAKVYVPWCDAIRPGLTIRNADCGDGNRGCVRVEPALGITLALVVEGHSVRALARRYRCRAATVTATVRRALERYTEIRDRTRLAPEELDVAR